MCKNEKGIRLLFVLQYEGPLNLLTSNKFNTLLSWKLLLHKTTVKEYISTVCFSY